MCYNVWQYCVTIAFYYIVNCFCVRKCHCAIVMCADVRVTAVSVITQPEAWAGDFPENVIAKSMAWLQI